MTDVAIIGMGCLFPGAPDLDTFWKNIVDGRDAIADAPPARLDPAFFGPGGLSCRRGGFVDELARFDPARHGVMPVAASAAEPDQLLALEVAQAALRDAGYEGRSFARERAGVILGRGGYAGAGRTRLEQQVRGAEQLVRALAQVVPSLSPAELLRIKDEFQAALGPAPSPEGAIGLVPNLAASRVAHRLDLHGPAFTVDAACASALVAVDHACVELGSGRCDVMLAGGAHLCHDEAFWTVFEKLGALSRTGRIRPFDRRADGLLIGEGIGIVVLKRRADAQRDGDRVYAVIRGTGVSSDGRSGGLVSPAVAGQVLALERAWRDAGLDPATVGLVEAHGTATPAGDAAELETLARVFGDGAPAVLGSVKSMIGHTMAAAGAAGLIKAALAAHHGVLPPTLHCDEPSPALARTRFRTLATAEAWKSSPRRAAVNAFGFGGINAHVVLDGVPARARGSTRARASRLVAVAAETPAALAAAIPQAVPGAPLTRIGSGPARLAILDPTTEKLARARGVVERGQPWAGRDDIFFSPRGLLTGGGRLAFLFPGVDAGLAGSLEEAGLGLVRAGVDLMRALGELGVVPDALAGHSVGEWSAMIAAGVIPDEVVDELAPAVRPGALAVPGVLFGAAGCSVERAEVVIADLPEIAVSHDNCPRQVILCGVEDSLDRALARLRADGVLCQKLPFQSGFHTPLFASHVGPHRERFARLPLAAPRLPLWSATTVARYPGDPAAIRDLAVAHLLERVRFRELTARLFAEGARVFVQLGAGSLPGFVDDTLRAEPHLALAAEPGATLRACAALFVEGAEPRLEKLLSPRQAPPLPLGVPLVNLGPTRAPPAAPPAQGSPLASAFSETLSAVERAGAEIAAALRPRERSTTRTLSLDGLPELIDHTFFRQPEGWPVISDRHPVVPMTALIALMIDAARELAPGLTAVAVEDARASRWLVVSTPVAARFHARALPGDRVHVSIEGYAEATVAFAARYPAAPAPAARPLAAERPSPVTAVELYRRRFMFHGPAYQGVVAIDAIGDDGIRGVLETGRAVGALLDNAGQLFGYWIMARNERDRLAMPVHIRRLSLFGPHPSPGSRVACAVHIRSEDARAVVADLVLAEGDRVWATIDGWEDRRFETDPRLWDVFLFPEDNLLAVPRPDGSVALADTYRGAPTREQLERRFLGARERAEYEAQPPRAQRAWLAGRIAAKDAARHVLWQRGAGPIFPVEIQVEGGRARYGETVLDVEVVVDGELTVARAG